MYKHIVMWKLKPELAGAEKRAVMEECKSRMESLNGKIAGLVHAEVGMDEAGEYALCLYSEFDDEVACKAYAVNPLHVEQAMYVRTNVCGKVSFNYVA